MAEEQSWKDIRNQRRKENFVGRGNEVRVFTENFDTPPRYMIFAVTGEGGVGKSTLLKRFTGIANAPEIEAMVITCDDRQTSPVAVMGYIAGELAKFGISHKEFDERYKTYLQLRQEIESDPKVSSSALKVISMGITDFTIKSLRKTPGFSPFLEFVDEKAAGEALGELLQYSISKWGNKDEVQLLREPESILTPLFLKLIHKACEKKRLVIMFDVFERTGDILTSWLLALFNFEYGEFAIKLSFVISGRDPLDQQWTDLAGMICYIRLEPFTLEETKLYLTNQGIADVDLSNQIYEDTGGLPVLVELLAATNPQPGIDLPDITKDAVERFLQWTPQEDRRSAALLAAVPRQFNRDVLGAILDDEAGEMFNWLAGQSYIRRTSERGWFYHEKVRELMLRYILKTTPSQLTIAHSKLSEYFGNSQIELQLTQEDRYKNETWCDLEIERVYHLSSTHPEQNIPETLNAFLHAFRWKWQFSEAIARLCVQVASEMGIKRLYGWSDILMALYIAYDQDNYGTVVEKINLIEVEKTLTPIAKSVLFSRRAWAFNRMKKHEEALADFNRAIELDEKDKWAIANRGETYRLMEKYEEALIDFNRAIELDEKYAWAIAVRGLTYSLMGKYDEALADSTRAIELDEKDQWTIASRGETYRLMEKYEEALGDFNRAIELDNKTAWAIALRGETYRLMKKYEEALRDFSRAIELDDKYIWAIASRAKTYQSIEKYEEALTDFSRAIELDDKYIWAIMQRGETYRLVEKYEEALTDFSLAIELNDKDEWVIASRGQTYQAMEKYEEAIADFTHAIELNDKVVWIIASRGQTYQAMEKYEEAITDFTRAIELDKKAAWVFASRGQTYRSMNKYEEAITDFTRAIELDKKTAWVFASRGQTYRSMNKYEEAIADFTRAIELDEKYVWAVAERGQTYRMIGKYEKSLADFTQAIELDDKPTQVFARRAETYRSMGRYKEALIDASHAIELDDKYSFAYQVRGQTYGQLSKLREALDNFTRSLELYPESIFVLSRRAAIFLAKGDTNAAHEDLDKALSLETKNATDHYNRAIVFILLQKTAEALKEFELAFEDPYPRVYTQTDDLLNKIRKTKKFQALLNKYK